MHTQFGYSGDKWLEQASVQPKDVKRRARAAAWSFMGSAQRAVCQHSCTSGKKAVRLSLSFAQDRPTYDFMGRGSRLVCTVLYCHQQVSAAVLGEAPRGRAHKHGMPVPGI